MSKRLFKQTKPCANCPFLKVGAIELHAGRLDDIIDTLLSGQGFLCHKHFYAKKRERQPCAGAIVYLEKADAPNTLMQVMDRMGAYPREEFLKHLDLVIDPPD